ncbi:MAG TPA: ATP-binding protein [Lachnospiraceae bacterium]|nr:ATP-binding protein [Lachnospiraceae bacterium]
MELMVFLPGMLLAYFPVKQYLRLRPAKLAAVAVPLILFLCLAGEAVCRFSHINILWLFFPAAAIMGSFYVHTLQVTRWKSVSVFLAVCGVFSCLGSAAIGISGETTPPFPPHTAALWFLMCCALTAASWYPASHAARHLLEDDAFAATWYVFWILPILFIGLNLFIMPRNPGILEQGRLRLLYTVFGFVFLALLLLSYLLFYLMASSLNRNARLRLENQFLSMQQARYDSLLTTTKQIRQARHDMRHHFHVLQGFAIQGNMEGILGYLSQVQGNIPTGDLGLCKNAVVDSVAGYFSPLYRENGIPLSFSLDLPRDLPVPDTGLCSVLSNLLENAMEASLRTAPQKRNVRVSARLHSGNMLLLSVENNYDGEVRERNGIFLSSKRPGEGIGLQAVQHTAEKSGGYCRFHYGDGVFTANVMLRGGK